MPHRVNGAGSLIASPVAVTASPGPRARSPLLDAVDLSIGGGPVHAPPTTAEPTRVGFDNHNYGQNVIGVGSGDGMEAGEEDGMAMGVVKIGQTSLHNPGGRSSWYGL